MIGQFSTADMLVTLGVSFIVIHVPIYLAHRRNKKNGRPPTIWVAALLGIVLAGGVTYVGGLVPGVIVYSLLVLSVVVTGSNTIIELACFALIVLCGIWAHQKKTKQEWHRN